MDKVIKNMQNVNKLRQLFINEYQDRMLKKSIPNKPLDLQFTTLLCDILRNNSYNYEDEHFLLNQFKNRITPGVDETSYEKAKLLSDICYDKVNCNIISKSESVKILGTMQGGYNVDILTKLLDNEELGGYAANELKNNILIFDYINDIKNKYDSGNPHAIDLLHSWANAEWFFNKPALEKKIELTVFRVTGETNTDDLSPAVDAWSRPDIPLHSLSMLKNARDGIIPDKDGEIGPMNQINNLKENGLPLVYVGDVVGTGSSRKSATNSILWHFGKDIKYVPNKKYGGFCFGTKISPIFFNTMEDSGSLPIEMDVTKLKMGEKISLYPYKNLLVNETRDTIIDWKLKTPTLLDSVRAGGRINLIIGKSLTHKSQEIIKKKNKSFFIDSNINHNENCKFLNVKYTLAQKIVGKACNLRSFTRKLL